VPPKNEADRDRALKAASACVAWETSASRLNRDENSQSRPNPKYVLTVARILVHYMMNGGFLGGSGEANRDNNYILEHVHRLKDIPVHILHGRYDRVCHLYQSEALVRALRAAGNTDLNYFITTAGHSSREPETESTRRKGASPSMPAWCCWSVTTAIFWDRVMTSTIANEGNGSWVQYADMLAQRPAARRSSARRAKTPLSRRSEHRSTERPRRLSFNDQRAWSGRPIRSRRCRHWLPS
jgi:hypothetical protein